MFDSRDELIHAATYIAYKNNTMDELYHHGILGMKWGVRRYQNEDGSYTEEGRRHYGMDINDKDTRKTKKMKTDYKELSDEDFKKKYWTTKDKYKSKVEKYGDPIKHKRKIENIIAAVGGLAIGAGAATVGLRILHDMSYYDPSFREISNSVEFYNYLIDYMDNYFSNH